MSPYQIQPHRPDETLRALAVHLIIARHKSVSAESNFLVMKTMFPARPSRKYLLLLFPAAMLVVNNLQVFLSISNIAKGLSGRTPTSADNHRKKLLVSSASRNDLSVSAQFLTEDGVQSGDLSLNMLVRSFLRKQEPESAHGSAEQISVVGPNGTIPTRQAPPSVNNTILPVEPTASTWPMQWARFNYSQGNDTMWPIPGKTARMWYMHVGKTGGQTLETKIPIAMPRKRKNLDCIIKSMNYSSAIRLEDALNECDPKRSKETAISRHIVTYFHLSSPLFKPIEKEWSSKLTNTLLFTIRNPIDRIISAFHFHHNKKYSKARSEYGADDPGAIFFHDCFPNATVSTAIEAIQAKPRSVSEICRQTAHVAFQGYVSPRMLNRAQRKFPHFFYNYQWYLERYFAMDATPDVVVIRTSHLWEDTTAMDRALGGGDVAFRQPGTAFTHGSEGFKKNDQDFLSADHFTTLCCILHRDLQAYQWIVRMARNLKHEEKEEAIQDLMQTCGVENKDTPGDNGDLLSFLWEDWYQATCTTLLWKSAA